MSNTSLANKTDPCYSPEEGEYDLDLHIVSIFVVMVTSWLGGLLPVVISRFPKLYGAQKAMNFGRFFGTGVILSTVYIHIFPEAVMSLADPCLPKWFSEDYPASAGLFAMLATLIMHLAEWSSMYFSHTPEEAENHRHMPDHLHLGPCMMEIGISIHSVIIGLALGLSSGEFKALFIAIVFHQFFEGLGIGNVLADLEYEGRTKYAVWFFTFLYGITTPLGIAIGIIIHESSYDATSELIATGVLEAVASGILFYTCLVELMAEACSSKKFLDLPASEKSSSFLALFLGSAVMSVLGIWA